MKKNTLLIILTIIIVSIAVLGITYALINTTKDELSPKQVVTTFYTKWTNSYNNRITNKLYQDNPYLTKNFSQKIDQIINSFDKASYDPILCAQDVPSNFQIINETIKENEAVITVEEIFSSESSIMLEIILEKNDNWKIKDIICQEGQLNPNTDLNNSVSPAVQDQVGNYIKANISKLSSKKEVLGGKFYVTSIQFIDPYNAVVDYEDGHIALKAKATFKIPSANEVIIESFELLPEAKSMITTFEECKIAGNEIFYPDCVDCQPYCETKDGKKFEKPIKETNTDKNICVDKCGDGICQKIVCMGSDCPCAETKSNCPQDCK